MELYTPSWKNIVPDLLFLKWKRHKKKHFILIIVCLHRKKKSQKKIWIIPTKKKVNSQKRRRVRSTSTLLLHVACGVWHSDLGGMVLFQGLFKHDPSRKLTNVLPKKGTFFKRKFHLPTHWFSGDMLVFGGVQPKNLGKKKVFKPKERKNVLMLYIWNKRTPPARFWGDNSSQFFCSSLW